MRGLIIVPSLLARWWRFIYLILFLFFLLRANHHTTFFQHKSCTTSVEALGRDATIFFSCATASHFSLRLLLSARCLPTNSLSFNYYTPNNNSITHSLKRIFLQKKQDFKRRQHNRTTYYCRPRYYFVQPKITCRSTNHQVAVAAAAASRVAIEV